MKLKDLIIDDYELIAGNLDLDIESIENDSRFVKKSCLFIAEKGYKVNGHDFISDAIKKGAVAILIDDRNVEIHKNITYILVKNTSEYMKRVVEKFYNYPWKDLHMIGITGTNGKTSTSYILRNILKNKAKVGIIGTMGALVEDQKIDILNTTPNILTINKLLNSMRDSNIDYSIMEVSSHGLELNRIGSIKYEYGVFMNLAKDHLDYHKTVEKYFESKKKLFYITTKANLINIDDDYGKKIYVEKNINVKNYSFSIKQEADFFATDIVYKLDGVDFKFNTEGRHIDISLKIPGEFSVYNSLAAASVAYLNGYSLQDIKLGLESIDGVTGRFEVVPTNKNFTVIIDFAHTAEGIKQVLNTIEDFVEGRKIIVFGAGGDRDRSKRPEMGYIAGSLADYSIVTSDNPRSEDPEQIVDDVIQGVKKAGGTYKKIVDRQEAIHHALDIAKEGDIVLLTGKGHETYTIINDKIIEFDEKEIVLNYLKTTR